MGHVRIERDGAVATVRFDRAEKKNALSDEMWQDLARALDEVDQRVEDRALILTGSGDSFSAGMDLADADETDPARLLSLMRRYGSCAVRLHEMTKPTIAAVNGVAMGAGCNIALGCDLIIASERARFSQVFVHRALSIDLGGSWLLPRLVGIHKAKELTLLGDVIDASEAERIGIVNRVVPDAELEHTAMELARRLSDLPSTALGLTKQLLHQAYSLSFREAVDAESMAQAVNGATRDAAEARRAFTEKRPPSFVSSSESP
jgi:2-(1,2-epoxy-1,2-dihydrophenyl)acetyl-CoA isomerase